MRGFTLVELLIVVAMIAILGVSISALGFSLHRVESSSHAYHEDLFRLRRAVRGIEEDARAGTLEQYVLDGRDLKRAGRTVLERVERFDVQRDGRLASVVLSLHPRSEVATRRAEIRFQVAAR